jgi:hypothetical protein
MNGQNYNRYSYVLNNPTNLTDPTGFNPDYTRCGHSFIACFMAAVDYYTASWRGHGFQGAEGTTGDGKMVLPPLLHPSVQITLLSVGEKPSGNGNPQVDPKKSEMFGKPLVSEMSMNMGGEEYEGAERPGSGGSTIPPARGAAPIVQEAYKADAEGDGSPLGGGPARQEAWARDPGNVRALKQEVLRQASEGVGARAGGGASLQNLTPGEILRIQNAANRTGVEITLVGSRASGRTGPLSDWDYMVPENTSSRTIHSLRSSLPEGHRGIGEARNSEIIRGPVDPNRPFITFTPAN